MRSSRRRSSGTLVCALALVPLAACHRGEATAPIATEPPPWLITVVHDQAQQQAPGSAVVGNVFKAVAYDEGDRTEWDVLLEPGSCYWFSAAGDQGVTELYLHVLDPNGERRAKRKQEGPKNILAYCPTIAGMHKVEAKVSEGRGHYHLGVYAKAGPAQPVPPPAAPPATPAADLDGAIAGMAKSSAPGAEIVGQLYEGTTDKTDWYAQLEAGKCYWWFGAGEPNVRELFLYLWNPHDKRITENRADSNRVSLGHCPAIDGMYHFQAKVDSGSGRYKVGLYRKKR